MDQLILFFTDVTFPVILLTLGFLYIDREKFGRTILLVLTTLIITEYMKGFMNIPMRNGSLCCSYPSARMMIASTLYPWIAYEYRSKLFYLAFLMPLITGYALVDLKYHFPSDVASAFGFAMLFMISYNYIIQMEHMDDNLHMAGVYISLVTFPVMLIINNPDTYYLVIKLQSSMLAFSFAWFLLDKYAKDKFKTTQEKILALLLLLAAGAWAKYLPLFGLGEFLKSHAIKSFLIYSPIILFAFGLIPIIVTKFGESQK